MKYKVGDAFKLKEGEEYEIYLEDYGANILISKVEKGGINESNIYLVNGRDWLSEEELNYHYNKLEDNSDSFKTLFDSLCEMVEVKDKRYGNAALKPLDIFSKHHNYGSRIDEKLARVKNSNELRKNDVADLMGGLALICKDKGWFDFSDQID